MTQTRRSYRHPIRGTAMNWTAIIVFVLLFGLVTVLGFVAAHWRRGDLTELHEWGLAGRRLGTIITWFLLGGDIYTAYTFIAVPGLSSAPAPTAFSPCPIRSSSIRWSFSFFRACGRSRTSTTTSPPPTSSKAATAAAGSRSPWQ